LNKEIVAMKTHKLLLTFLSLTILLASGCSSAALALNSPFSVAVPQNQTASSVAIPTALAPVTAVYPAEVAASSVEAFQSTLESVYAQVNPSVVNVEVTINTAEFSPLQGTPFGFSEPMPSQQGLGSGFVWDAEGHIVTNNHVVDGANRIMVTFFDGTTREAKVVGTDPYSDLAVIQVDAPADLLHPVTLMDSDQVKVGQLAIAIGNPYGLSGTMTSGIVSALSRSLPVGLDNPNAPSNAHYSIPDIIQTDAALNPGNSGGVLVNDQGQVMGVTVAIQSTTGANTGIGFVIPANIIRKVVPELIKSGHVDHPWMGISGTTLTPDLAQAMGLPQDQQGVLVLEVTANSPAAQAGLRGGSRSATINGNNFLLGGDVITAIDGQTVKHFEDLASYLFNQTEVGQKVTLSILRDGKTRTLSLTLGVLPKAH
jgi:2-alkenal reductase